MKRLVKTRRKTGFSRAQPIAFAGGHDRSFHQDVPLAREVIGLLDPRARRKRCEEGPDIGEMHGAGLSHRVARVEHLEQDVDEGAALEVIPLEPLVEHIEDGQ